MTWDIEDEQVNPRLWPGVTAKIIKDHGGIISFESDIGQGMTVNISLPSVTETTQNA